MSRDYHGVNSVYVAIAYYPVGLINFYVSHFRTCYSGFVAFSLFCIELSRVVRFYNEFL